MKSAKQLLADCEWLDRCYAQADAFDAARQPIGPLDEKGYFDAGSDGTAEADAELRRAALDHRGRP